MKIIPITPKSVLLLLLIFKVTAIGCSPLNEDDAAKLIRVASNDYFKTILNNGYVAPARYVEVASCENVYCMFTLADGYLHSAGYDALIPVANFSFVSNNIMKSDRNESWKKTLDASYKAMPQFSYHSDVQPGISSLFSAFRFFEKNGPLSNHTEYNFEFVETDSLNTDDLIAIQFEPKTSGNYKGVIWLGKNDNRIRKIDLEAMPFYSQNFQQWVRVSGSILYRSGKNYLAVKQIAIEKKMAGLDYKIVMLSESPLEYDRKVPEHEFKYLGQVKMNPIVFYDQAKNDLLINSFSFLNMDSIRAGLETEYTLEEQFRQNADKPYLYRKYHNGEIRTVDWEEETYSFLRSFIRHFDNLQKTNNNNQSDLEPKVYIPEKRINLGTFKVGENIKASFEVFNEGTGVLEIYNIKPDCTFTSVQNEKAKINPGEKSIIHANLNTANLYGSIAKHITLETNTFTRFYNLTVQLNVE